MKFIFICVVIFIGCTNPQPPHPLTYPTYPIYSNESNPTSPLPHKIKPQLCLEFTCKKQQRIFRSETSARNIEQSLKEMGFMTSYREWKLRPFPPDPNDLHSPFRKQKDDIRYMVNYWTDGVVRKNFDNEDMAKLWQLKLRELGCEVKLHSPKAASTSSTKSSLHTSHS